MKKTKKITSRKDFAIALSNGNVDIEMVSIKLDRVVKLWLKRKEIVIEGMTYKLTK